MILHSLASSIGSQLAFILTRIVDAGIMMVGCDCNVRFGGMIGVAERQESCCANVGKCRFLIRRE